MKIGRVFPDLLTPLGAAASFEEGLARTLRRLVSLTGAGAGALVFRPPRAEPIVLTAGARRLPLALDRWLRGTVVAPIVTPTLGAVSPPSWTGRGAAVALWAALGSPRRPVGTLVLLGRRGALTRRTLPTEFPRELGAALEQVWRLHQRTLRLTVLNDLTRLLTASASLDDVLRGFVESLARLVRFDSLGVSMIDAERGEFEILDVLGRSLPGIGPRDLRLPLANTLLEALVAAGLPLRVDDVEGAGVPEPSRRAFAAQGYRSALLVPLVSRGGVFGAVTLASHHPSAFDDADVEVATELARPLASAVEQRRLLDESRRRAEELAALYDTSQLITARLDVATVLERISRSVTALIGSTGCGIALLDADGARLVQAAAHGFRSDEWRSLSIPVGEGIIGLCAATETAIRVGDVLTDRRSARRDVDEREGIRSMLCVPLRVGGGALGVISAFSTRPAAFTEHHQRVLEAFAEQAGVAIHNARLFEESVRRGRETRALFEAGRAVTATLDVNRTIRVIMEEARSVLGVDSCGIMTPDPASGDLVSVASLDLPPEMIARVRLHEGEGIAGRAVKERRPIQSADLHADERVRYPELPRASGFRSMLSVPLTVGERTIGAISVFRHDVHRFSEAEQELLVALAGQAAIALEHARLYEHLEGMVAERTLELDRQKRFVEVVLERLPLGVFVLDADLRVVRVNREGTELIPCEPDARGPLPPLLGPGSAEPVEVFLREAFASRRVSTLTQEVAAGAEPRLFRLTAAPFEPDGGDAIAHVVLLVEDVTRAKHLERQMLLTERLTTAGRLAAGVAHELNNPLATIAGCAESLQARLKDLEGARPTELGDFASYLGLIEEEAYRCKEITGSLLQFVRDPGSRRGPTDLNALALKTVELLSHQSRFAQGGCVTELDPDLPEVTVNEGQLRQVFLGLAANALEAMGGAGRLTIRTRRRRGQVEVEFEDEGPGIPDEIIGRIFDPFFTTKPPGQGTGLGLAIAQGIVADHGGHLEVISRVGQGSVFRVSLPS